MVVLAFMQEQWMGCLLCKVCIFVRIKTYTHIYFRILYWFLLHQNNVLNFLHLHLRFWCLILIRLVSTLHSWVQLLYGIRSNGMWEGFSEWKIQILIKSRTLITRWHGFFFEYKIIFIFYALLSVHVFNI